MLTAATAEGMVYGVHGHAPHNGPLLGLGLELEEALARFDQGLVQASSTGHNTNGGHALG